MDWNGWNNGDGDYFDRGWGVQRSGRGREDELRDFIMIRIRPLQLFGTVKVRTVRESGVTELRSTMNARRRVETRVGGGLDWL